MYARNERSRIALNSYQLALFVEHQLPTTHAAIWADRAAYLRVLDLGGELLGLFAHHLLTGAFPGSGADLLEHGPFSEEAVEHRRPLRGDSKPRKKTPLLFRLGLQAIEKGCQSTFLYISLYDTSTANTKSQIPHPAPCRPTCRRRTEVQCSVGGKACS
jgi:hypothetical protein